MDDLEFVSDLAEMELMKLNPTLSGQPLTEKAKKYFLSEIRSRRWELGRGATSDPPDRDRGSLIRCSRLAC